MLVFFRIATVFALCFFADAALAEEGAKASEQEFSEIRHQFGDSVSIFRDNNFLFSPGNCPTLELMTNDRKFIKRKLCKFPDGFGGEFDFTKEDYTEAYIASAGFDNDGFLVTIDYTPARGSQHFVDCNIPISPTSFGTMGCVSRYPIEKDSCDFYRNLEKQNSAADVLHSGMFTYTRANPATQSSCPTIAVKSKKGVEKTREYCVFPGRQGKSFDIRKDTIDFKLVDTRLDNTRLYLASSVRMKGDDASRFRLTCYINFTKEGGLLNPECSLKEIEKDCPEENIPGQP